MLVASRPTARSRTSCRCGWCLWGTVSPRPHLRRNRGQTRRGPAHASRRNLRLGARRAQWKLLWSGRMDVIEAIGNTPLIELKKVAKGLPNRVFIKCEHLNPGGSVKDRTARALILDAEARGVLVPFSNPPMTIIEGTAGNTG